MMTVLLARSGVMTKTIKDGTVIRGYSGGKFYRVRYADVASFGDMEHVLDSASGIPEACIIRGDHLPHADPENCRRLSNKAEHGDAVTFAPAPRQWLGIDVDNCPEPAGVDFAREPEEGIEHVIGLLPEPFHDACCWWQATSSGGIKPGINCRLWFWLSRAIDDGECKGWLQHTPADRALYNAVQPHYVAAPIVLSGPDPMARRQGVRQGLDDTVEVPAKLPRVETVEPLHLEFTGADPDDATKRRVASVIKNTPLAREIWEGKRDYGGDRSRRHFAFAGALLRGGIFDGFNDDWADCLAFALGKLDERLGADTSKVNRPDYIKRTIEAVVAKEAAR